MSAYDTASDVDMTSHPLNILDALTGEAATAGALKCKLQRWLDNIPDETPGKTELAATFATTNPADPNYRPLDALDRVARRLNFHTSIKTIGDHRAGRCRCQE